jgi:DNA integrity scanning protein DisA with diadenylate cyclase activity
MFQKPFNTYNNFTGITLLNFLFLQFVMTSYVGTEANVEMLNIFSHVVVLVMSRAFTVRQVRFSLCKFKIPK